MNKKILLVVLAIFCLSFFVATVAAQTEESNIVQIEVSFDNELSSKTPDIVKDSSGYIDIGVSKLYGNETTRYLAKIDVSSLDLLREIESAIFKIDRVSSTWDKDNNYSLCLVNEPWNTNDVTWNNQPSFGGTGTEGIYTSYGIFKFDFTNLVKDWVSNSDSNNGFLVMKTYEKDIENELVYGEANRGMFASINYSTAGGETRPYLEITYATTEMEPIADLSARAKDNKVQIVWTHILESASYNVYRDSGEGFEFLVNTTSTYSTYLDMDVPPGDHTYMVRWTNENGKESPDSNLVQVTIGGTPPPIFSWVEPNDIITVFDFGGEEKTVSGIRTAGYPNSVDVSIHGVNWMAVSYTVSQEEGFVEILFDEPVSAGYIRVQETRAYGSVYVGTAMLGDFDGDGQVCRTDLDILMQYRNQPASEFPQGDLDGDGIITVLDARKLVLLCTSPRCACN